MTQPHTQFNIATTNLLGGQNTTSLTQWETTLQEISAAQIDVLLLSEVWFQKGVTHPAILSHARTYSYECYVPPFCLNRPTHQGLSYTAILVSHKHVDLSTIPTYGPYGEFTTAQALLHLPTGDTPIKPTAIYGDRAGDSNKYNKAIYVR